MFFSAGLRPVCFTTKSLWRQDPTLLQKNYKYKKKKYFLSERIKQFFNVEMVQNFLCHHLNGGL
jgi:hypothetical protein